MEKETTRICCTVDDMARMLGIGRTNAYRIANDKSFYPAKRICGKKISISIELLNKWIKEQNKEKDDIFS